VSVHISVSGWSYPHWRGAFYPEKLAASRQLSFVSEQFDSVEVNRSFYALLTPDACRSWYEQTPKGFLFTLKGSRFITHMKKLRNVDTALANFFASGPLALHEKLGPIVWQLPAALAFDEARVAEFLAQLPRTNVEAAALAERHDDRLKRGAYLVPGKLRRLRHALEPRHESFQVPAFARLARKHGVAIVAADSAGWPLIEEVTADFVYLRLHGHEHTYTSAYSEPALARWARHIAQYRSGQLPVDAQRISTLRPLVRKQRDVFVYFDNDGHAHAPRDALALRSLLRDAGAKSP
jgi:uncharacterized protein YecE (DUF72 family)